MVAFTIPSLGKKRINKLSVENSTKLNSNGSKNYPYRRVGDRHKAQYGPLEHWVLIVGYEGTKEAPTHFILKDPDFGG